MPRVVDGWEGRAFEDFEVGDIYVHPYGRTVNAADNTWFTLLTMNMNEIHFNSDYASKTEWKKPLVNSTLTLALATGMSVMDVSQNAINLGWDEVTLPNPLFEGDTLYAQTEVVEKRESKSRSKMGIVKLRTKAYKEDGTVVLTMSRTIMVWKKDDAPGKQLSDARKRLATRL